ncbi:hypothetical protein MNV49_000395 [Pseudohyphozyma bogoriensis]|nr:hypothetical protein MNV49_000395 [Pseudohyphozyma bogoriensis]
MPELRLLLARPAAPPPFGSLLAPICPFTPDEEVHGGKKKGKERLPSRYKRSETSAEKETRMVADIAQTIKRYDSTLPGSRLSGSEGSRNLPGMTLEAAELALRQLVATLRGHVTIEQKLDVARLLGRLARVNLVESSVPPSSSTFFDVNPLSLQTAATPEELEFRRRAATRMRELVDTLPERPREHSRAAIIVDSTLLLNSLSPPHGRQPAGQSRKVRWALKKVFNRRPDESEAFSSTIRNQWHTLTALLDHWETLEDGPERALRFLVDQNIASLFASPLDVPSSLARQRSRLRQRYGHLLSRLPPSPETWFSNLPIGLRSSVVGPPLISLLALTGSPLSALHVWDRLRSLEQSLPIGDDLQSASDLLEGLLRAKLLEDARVVSRHLSERAASSNLDQHRDLVVRAYRIAGKASAQSARPADLSEFLERLENMGWIGELERTSRRMRLASELGNLPGVREAFNEGAEQGGGEQRDRVRLCGELVRAYVRVDDLDGANKAVDELQASGLAPNLATINSLVSGHAARTNVEEAYACFDRLSELGHTPNIVSFNALVALHANRNDPESVERVIQDIRQAGLQPDRYTWVGLMNAHVEIGQWREGLEIFNFLQSHQDPSMHPDTAATNVLLKAATLAGAPASVNLQIFLRATQRGLRPNAHMYTQLMHSLCVSGMIDQALELFAMMDSDDPRLPTPMHKIRPGVHIFSTLIYGYLRAGNHSGARSVIREMRARGIAATSVTYGIVVASFLRQNTDAGLEMALSLAKNFLVEAPLESLKGTRPTGFDPQLARGEELLTLFNPIISHFAKSMNAALALDYFREVLQRNVKPSLMLYTTLMDAYRKVDDIESVRHLWQHVHQALVETYPNPHPAASDSLDTQPAIKVVGSRANALCRPLSIYLDALASGGLYEEVQRVWAQQVAEGFNFDASNWNMLGIAATGAGDLNVAFFVSEFVLCEGRDAPGDVDRGSTVLGSLAPTEGSMETRDRLYVYRGGNRYQHRRDRDRTSFEELLGAGLEDVDVAQSLETTATQRRRHYWYPHRSFLRLLDTALEYLPISAEEKQRWKADNPRTMGAIRELQERGGDALH